MLSSIQQQMQLLNPPKEASEGLQLDFTAAAEEDFFFWEIHLPAWGMVWSWRQRLRRKK
jgi:hypothetical protein